MPLRSILLQEYSSPCGALILGAFGGSLFLCDWNVGDRIEKILSSMKKFLNFEPSDVDSLIVDKARRQLDEYFNGKRMEFDVPVNLIGTPFRESVWRSLLTITYGSTTSYSAFSRLMGRPGAVRAIANAIGANPLSIFLPCHRVVGADGSLTGYAGGLKAKKYLLELEQVNSIENRCLK